MGRKKSKVGGKTDVRIRMDTPLSARVEAAAKAVGLTVAAFIRSTVIRELNRRMAEGPKDPGR